MKRSICICSKKEIIALAVVTVMAGGANAQQKVPRNYIAFAGIYEAGSISLTAGLEYERWLVVQKSWVLTVKGQYVFPHKSFNVIWPSDDLLKSNSQAQLFSTAYFYTTRKKDKSGFILGLGGGVNYVRFRTKVYTDNTGPYEITNDRVMPGFEVSTGLQWNFGKRFGAKVITGLSHFVSNKEQEFVENLPLILLFTKVSFGF